MPGSPASAVQAVTHHGSDGLSVMQRWTTRASESQFNALSGAVGGFTSGIVTCPLDVIKTKLQAQGGFTPVDKGRHVGHHKVYEGLIGTARVIWREEGIRGMYRGLGPIILGYLPTWAVWFTVYTKSKEFLAERDGKSLPLLNSDNTATRPQDSSASNTLSSSKSDVDQLLVVHSRGCLEHSGHQPYLGDQDSTHVTILQW